MWSGCGNDGCDGAAVTVKRSAAASSTVRILLANVDGGRLRRVYSPMIPDDRLSAGLVVQAVEVVVQVSSARLHPDDVRVVDRDAFFFSFNTCV